jgi:orotate phosphoribosyltransferase
LQNTELLEKAKENMKYKSMDVTVDHVLQCRTLYDQILQGIVQNVKMGPFTATSGVILQYYLNAATNFLDKKYSPKIVDLFSRFLVHWLPSPKSVNELYLVCGMEMAGGVIVSQLASQAESHLADICDFVYVRKNKKETGTAQQLEGPTKYTTRTPTCPPVIGVWVDDALSTGQSLRDGIVLLKNSYNIHIKYVLYLVDRYQDRAKLVPERQFLADDVFTEVQITALYDLKQVDDLVPKK